MKYKYFEQHSDEWKQKQETNKQKKTLADNHVDDVDSEDKAAAKAPSSQNVVNKIEAVVHGSHEFRLTFALTVVAMLGALLCRFCVLTVECGAKMSNHFALVAYHRATATNALFLCFCFNSFYSISYAFV